MPGAGKNRVLTAGACCIAGALLVGIPIDIATQPRFFLAGVLIGTAIVLITLGKWTRFK
jgi:hypothetical protein